MKNEKVKVGITDSHSQIRCPYALFSVCNCITTAAAATRSPPPSSLASLDEGNNGGYNLGNEDMRHIRLVEASRGEK